MRPQDLSGKQSPGPRLSRSLQGCVQTAVLVRSRLGRCDPLAIVGPAPARAPLPSSLRGPMGHTETGVWGWVPEAADMGT